MDRVHRWCRCRTHYCCGISLFCPRLSVGDQSTFTQRTESRYVPRGMRLPLPSCHALRVIFLGASHHALASPRAFCYAFRTRSYGVLSHNRDLLHLIRGPMLGLLSVPHPERRSIRASCNHVYASGTIFEELLSPPPYRGHCLSGCDITSMGICLSRGCPSPCCCASLDPPVSYV